MPARFDEMTRVERWTWPDRIIRPWRRRRAQQVAAACCVVLALALVLDWPIGTSLGLLGLVLDVIGVYILAEGVIISDDDASFLSTYGRMEHGHLLAMRDSRQARMGLRLAIAGFVFQALGGLAQIYLATSRARLGLF
jgi:hypothetical protein